MEMRGVHSDNSDSAEVHDSEYFVESLRGPDNVRPAGPFPLRPWWTETAYNDADAAINKRDEYGSSDLRIMGAVLESVGWAPAGAGQECAVMLYELGKVARALGAYAEGKTPSDDTLHDTTVYSMMARRIRETGGW